MWFEDERFEIIDKYCSFTSADWDMYSALPITQEGIVVEERSATLISPLFPANPPPPGSNPLNRAESSLVVQL